MPAFNCFNKELIMPMKRYITLFLVYTICINNPFLIAQEDSFQTDKKGSFFLYWGYNRSKFSNTNLHFNGPNYDFTLYDIKATDRPSEFGWQYINPATFTVPQYNIRAGYFFSNRLAISLGMDHMKYVVTQNQETRISGVINSEASSRYAGSYLNQPIILEEDLLKFEHTNGFNLVSTDIEYLLAFKRLSFNNFSFNWNFGIGGIWIVTKTDVRVFGDGLDNDFHVAGYTLAAKTGPRIEYKKRFFILGEIKGGYASLPSVLIKNAEPELGDHNLTYIEYYCAIGMYFKLKGRNKQGKL